VSWVDDLKEGDFVAYEQSYPTIRRGVVVELTQKLVKVEIGKEIKKFYKHSQILQGYSNDWRPPRITEWTEHVEQDWKVQNVSSAIQDKINKIRTGLPHIKDLETLKSINSSLNDIIILSTEDK